MLNFKPMTEDEIKLLSLVPYGDYAFRVKHAEPKTSDNGNTYIKMIVAVHHNNREWNIYDNLMTLESMLFKLRHFCYAVGLDTAYEAGTLRPEDCINMTGVCKIGIKEDKKGEFPPKNIVLDYLKAENVVQKPGQAASAVASLKDDDIPF